MRALLCALGLMGWDAPARGVGIDTLRNHDRSAPLTLLRYGQDVGDGKGLLLGHNSHYRQQFAEKYGLPGGGKVLGLTAHLGGVFANGNNTARFALYAVARNGLPGDTLASVEIRYQDLDLSGGAMAASFGPGQAVGDSFFVALSVGDYAHGGYAGDTLGLYSCEAGCRTERDLDLYGRNVVQWHNHDKTDWHDLYYQNFTPVAIHLALYPLVERPPAALAPSGPAAAWSATLRPRQGEVWLTVRRASDRQEDIRVDLLDLQGREVYRSGNLRFPAGTQAWEGSTGRSLRGTYLLGLTVGGRRETRTVAIP